MRSGRGKCPQCKEQIVVDLDAAEIRCPYCNALLKKSAKSPDEVRAEKEKERAEREAAAAAAAAAVAEVEQPAPAPVEPAPEPAPVETATVEAPAEPVDEIGISDEELAMMDDVPPEMAETSSENAAEEIPVDDAFTTEAPAPAPAANDDEPLVFGSIGAVADDATPEEADAARIAAEDAATDLPEEDAAPINGNITLEDDASPASEPEEESSEEEAPALEFDTSREVASDPWFDSVAEPEEAAAETPAVEKAPAVEEASVPEPPAPEPAPVAPAPAEEAPAPEAPAEETYVPTEEDMAFAASLSNVGRTPNRVGFVAVENADDKKKKSKRKSKETASEGEKTMKGSSVYKKPVALIMTILSILAAAFWFLYYKTAVFTLISIDLAATVSEKVPLFGGEMFPYYVIAGFAGLIALVSILGLTGRNGKMGFLFILLADVVFALVNLFGAAPIVEVEAIQKIVAEYGQYADYAIYGLLALGAIFLAISLGRGKGDFSAGGLVLPLIYLALVVAGYVVLIMLPKFMDGFTLSADLERYVILGAIGAALLMTFVGVHDASLSRSVNAWFVFATVLAVALINFVPIIVDKFLSTKEVPLESYAEIPFFLTPIIAIFAVAGFTASDMRN